jgi:hypothetical protein
MTMAEVQAWQASYGLQVACAYYTMDRVFLSKLGPKLLWEFQHVLLAWHKLLKLESTSRLLFQASYRHLASQELLSNSRKKSYLVVSSTCIKAKDKIRSQAKARLRKVFGSAIVPRLSD